MTFCIFAIKGELNEKIKLLRFFLVGYIFIEVSGASSRGHPSSRVVDTAVRKPVCTAAGASRHHDNMSV